MTRSELLEVVYRFYPRGLPSHDPLYDATEERRRLVAAARRGALAYPTWEVLISRLADRYNLQNESLSLLAGWVEPAYSARIYLPGDATLGLHVCALGPYYGVHPSGAAGEASAAAACDVAREIEGAYPGYAPIPPELGNEVVPDVEMDGVLFGEATIYICLFSYVWRWVR